MGSPMYSWSVHSLAGCWLHALGCFKRPFHGPMQPRVRGVVGLQVDARGYGLGSKGGRVAQPPRDD